jgi:hypothetical protein
MRSLSREARTLAWAALVGFSCGGGKPGSQQVTIAGDTSPSGIFDPSVVSAGDHVWMSYSSVDYHQEVGRLVQDVGIRMARSDDGGRSWTYVGTVASPSVATVVDPDPGRGLCGAPSCSGRWVYETSWLVEDPTDVPGRRWKLFAHQYFLHPPSTPATQYHLGATVTWAAPSPDQLGGSPTTALRWSYTPASFTGGVDVNGLDSALAGCLALAEGAATARPGELDLVLACPYVSGSALPQKIVMLRSADHGATYAYLSTLLDAPDAAGIPGASFFTAPALLPGATTAPVLIVTPSASGRYAGCDVIPFADVATGTLARDGGAPRITMSVATGAGLHGGACAYDVGLEAVGLLMSEVDPSQPAPVFRIRQTGRVP